MIQFLHQIKLFCLSLKFLYPLKQSIIFLYIYIGSSTQAPSSSHSNFSEAESSATGYDSKSNVSSWSSRGRGKPRSNTDPPSRIVSLRSGAVGKTSSVTWDRTDVR